MIERDLDVFGQTVNLASRIAGRGGPRRGPRERGGGRDGSVRVGFGFERSQEAHLKGLPEPVALYRVTPRVGA